MPGVYTTAITSEAQPYNSFPVRQKPKNPVITVEPMASDAGEEERNANGSPLIDLTSRSPSPSPPSLASTTLTVPNQLLSYAQSAQTHVMTTVAPTHTTASQATTSPAPNNPLEHVPPPSTSEHMSGSVGEPVATLTLTSSSAVSPTSAATSLSSVASAAVSTSASSQLPRLQGRPPPTEREKRSVDNLPPALVDYGDLPSLTDNSEHVTGPPLHVKSEHLHLHRAPVPSVRTTTTLAQHSAVAAGTPETQGTAVVVSQELIMSPAESTVPRSSSTAGVASSVRPSQVGVVSPQVGGVLSEPLDTDFPPLRIKCSVGDEMELEGGECEERGHGAEGEEGESEELTNRESNSEEEDADSVMELHIEEPGIDSGNELEVVMGHVHTQTTGSESLQGVATEHGAGGNKRGEGRREVMEIVPHSNSVSTSPPPRSVGVKVQRHTVVSTDATTRLLTEELNLAEESPHIFQRRLREGGRKDGSTMTVPSKLSKVVHTDQQTVSHVSTNASQMHRGLLGTAGERVAFNVSPTLLRGSEDRFEVVEDREKGMVATTGHNGDTLASYRVRKVAKVKQFFTTLQHFGNRQSSEVAEQVQELIAALVNGTATIEEFHQEIQTVTNHPLRQFIIPFLKENLNLFCEELHNSEQALSDILGHPSSSSPPTSIAVTPQMIDDDLPVLPSSKPPLTPTLTPTLTSASPSLRLTAEPATHASSLPSTAPPATTNSSVTSRSISSQTHSTIPTARMTFEPSDDDSAHFAPTTRKRQRRMSIEKPPVTSDVVQNTAFERSLSSTKRARHDLSHTQSSSSMDTVAITSTTHRVPAPTYPYPPTLTPHQHTHTPSHSPHDSSTSALSHPDTPTHSQVHTATQVPLHPASSRKQLLSEDWAHLDMMLNSVVGMVDKVRSAMAVLRDRALTSNSDFEKRELEQERAIQQRLMEANEKARRLWHEEKLLLQREASRKMKEAVGQVKAEMEQKIAQAQSLAVQETLKEANIQTSSKESCWNCGRRATETCSGCNKARYCGTFCQHKDWGSHMHQCASGLGGMTEEGTTSSGGATQHVIIQSGDVRMTSSTDEPLDIKPRISPEQLMSIPQITVRYPMT